MLLDTDGTPRVLQRVDLQPAAEATRVTLHLFNGARLHVACPQAFPAARHELRTAPDKVYDRWERYAILHALPVLADASW